MAIADAEEMKIANLRRTECDIMVFIVGDASGWSEALFWNNDYHYWCLGSFAMHSLLLSFEAASPHVTPISPGSDGLFSTLPLK
jgi:hypothetical protein